MFIPLPLDDYVLGGKFAAEILEQAQYRVRRRLTKPTNRGVYHYLGELGHQFGVPFVPLEQREHFFRAHPQGVHWPQDSSAKKASRLVATPCRLS